MVAEPYYGGIWSSSPGCDLNKLFYLMFMNLVKWGWAVSSLLNSLSRLGRDNWLGEVNEAHWWGEYHSESND